MQIQRWQSVFLLIASVLMAIYSFVAVGQLQTPDFTFIIKPLALYPEGEYTGGISPQPIYTVYYFALALLSAIIPLIAIFCYNNFRLQTRLCLITMLLLVGIFISAGVAAYGTLDDAIDIDWFSTVLAPYISMVCVYIAYWRIKADNRKIRDSERLR